VPAADCWAEPRRGFPLRAPRLFRKTAVSRVSVEMPFPPFSESVMVSVAFAMAQNQIASKVEESLTAMAV